MSTVRRSVSPRPPDVLRVVGLGIDRGGTRILREVSWRVGRHQHWAILGANGSGKTSLLSAVTGYLMPTKGEIFLLGHRYGESDWRDLRKRVGIVSSSVRRMMNDDELAIETVVSGKFAMIDLWGRITRTDRELGMRLLRHVECAYLVERPWRVLSQGERQRVLIARALMAQPQLLILDEPCAGLDPAAREHFLQFLQRLGRRKASPTLILVTHHVEEIMPVFSHVLLLRSGRVLAAGAKSGTLTSGLLSSVFATRAKLERSRGRYTMRVSLKSGIVV